MDYYRMIHTNMELALWRRKVAMIIAMQGGPNTGKTELAKSLARKLECQVIPFHETLDALDLPSSPEEAENLISVAFTVVTQVIKAQTSSGDSVIIDSPLSHGSHLHNLAALDVDVEGALSRLERSPVYMEHEAHEVARRVVIIECKPKYTQNWETHFSNHACSSSSTPTKWYEHRGPPRKSTLDPRLPLVSKLVVDTSDFVDIEDVVDALRRLTTANKGERAELSKERERRNRLEASAHITPSGARGSCSRRHEFGFQPNLVVSPTDTRSCKACEEKISGGPVYTCRYCSFTIHKPCAELETTFSPQEFPRLLELPATKPYVRFLFPDHHPCEDCKWRGNESCNMCLFDSNLKWQTLPTILHHPGHMDHPLVFWVSNTSSRATHYQCAACRFPGDYVGYGCCRRCDTNCHPQCALLPLVVRKHRHGGHEHDLGLEFHRHEVFDEYVCTLCQENMHPKAWYYSCITCEVECHLECAFKDFESNTD